MATTFGSRSFRHVVDVDGQLHGVEERLVAVSTLLALAGRDGRDTLFRVDRGCAVALDPARPVALSEDEVAFFETASAVARHPMRLAA